MTQPKTQNDHILVTGAMGNKAVQWRAIFTASAIHGSFLCAKTSLLPKPPTSSRTRSREIQRSRFPDRAPARAYGVFRYRTSKRDWTIEIRQGALADAAKAAGVQHLSSSVGKRQNATLCSTL